MLGLGPIALGIVFALIEIGSHGLNTNASAWGIFATTIAVIQVGLGLLAFLSKNHRKRSGYMAFVFAAFWGLIAITDFSLSAFLFRQKVKLRAHDTLIGCMTFVYDHELRWPKTLDDLSPQYLSKDDIRKADFGDGKIPGFEYTPPPTSGTTRLIVLISKAPVYGSKYVVAYSDGLITEEAKPFINPLP